MGEADECSRSNVDKPCRYGPERPLIRNDGRYDRGHRRQAALLLTAHEASLRPVNERPVLLRPKRYQNDGCVSDNSLNYQVSHRCPFSERAPAQNHYIAPSLEPALRLPHYQAGAGLPSTRTVQTAPTPHFQPRRSDPSGEKKDTKAASTISA
jgi:hypothetical protein